MAVAELKNINSASSNEHLKIGKKREKRGYFAPSNGHHRRRGGTRGAENFFGDSLFYALQHTKIWSNSERSSHKSVWKVKILPIYIYARLRRCHIAEFSKTARGRKITHMAKHMALISRDVPLDITVFCCLRYRWISNSI